MSYDKWNAVCVVAVCLVIISFVWAVAWVSVEHNREAYEHGRMTTHTTTFGTGGN